MNTENKIFICIIILGIIVSLFITYKAIPTMKESNSLTEIKILNQKVELNNTTKLYKNNIDCTNLKVNEQIISYILKDNQNSKVSASIKVFKDNTLLIDDYKDATNIETRLLVKTKQKEQIYIIESTCQQGEVS